MLDNGCVTWGTAVNDAHGGSDTNGQISKGCVKVFAQEETAESIWEALCKGCFIATTHTGTGVASIGFENGVYTVTTSDENAVTVFRKEEGTLLKTVTGTTASYTMDGSEKYVRAIITMSDGNIIWTQPVINVSYYNVDDYEYTY